ncbi:MAG: hypothetical protein DME96_12655 [Verrucomicrobia bacterium]|nr:MAG: hypothetical protein DME93_11280 [Verrucomicrobiota bacterium]PYJ15671.1 MAG: hypothetical protein DME96_12655 [Verrucomicrobiota bacterium]
MNDHPGSAPRSLAGFGVAPNKLCLPSRPREGMKAKESSRPRDAFANTRDVCATLDQISARMRLAR